MRTSTEGFIVEDFFFLAWNKQLKFCSVWLMLFLFLGKIFSFQIWGKELKTKIPGSKNFDGRNYHEALEHIQPKYIGDMRIAFLSRHTQA